MPSEYATPDDVVNYVSSEILAGPEDDVWDNIFDWIVTHMYAVISAVASDFYLLYSWFQTNVVNPVLNVLNPIKTAIDWVKDKASSIWTWVYGVYTKVSDWVTNAWNTIYGAAKSAILDAKQWIVDSAAGLWNWITTKSKELWDWITTKTGEVKDKLVEKYHEVKDWVTTKTGELKDSVTTKYNEIKDKIKEWWDKEWADLKKKWEDFKKDIAKPVTDTLDAWWDDFIGKLLDFPSWVGKLLDAIGTWYSEEIPGYSPRWHSILDTIWANIEYFFSLLASHPEKVVQNIISWVVYFIQQVLQYTVGGVAVGVFMVLQDLVRPLADTLIFVLNNAMDLLTTQFKAAGQGAIATPESLTGMLRPIMTTVLSGLAVQTIAGEFTIAGTKIGLGNVSAMIYDLTNYKVLTGAFVTALSVAAIRTPLTYYYNNAFRPNLPRLHEASEMFAEDDLTKAEFYQLLAYEGYADVYHDKFADIAYAPPSMFALSSLVTAGTYDEALFADMLRSRRLRPEWRALILGMYRAKSTETAKGTLGTVAMTRFKEGITTEEQFTSELKLLSYTDAEIPKYLVAGRLGFATDYVTAMKAAYKEAVEKGSIGIDEYRDYLTGLGLVPDMVQALVIWANAYLHPKAAVKKIAAATPTYQTDAGKLQVDTLRRKRRKNIITRDEEIAGLITLGMDPADATAYADNDDVRLAEKGGVE